MYDFLFVLSMMSYVEIHGQRLKNGIFQVEHCIQQLHKEKVEQRKLYKELKII